MFFFFFQAEDGIRDYKVTGVQTCALPISPFGHRLSPGLYPFPQPTETKMSTSKNEFTQQSLLERVNSVKMAEGNPRARAIVARIVSDLFKTIDELDVSPDEFWAAADWLSRLGASGQIGLITAGLGFDRLLDIRMDEADAKAGIAAGTPRAIEIGRAHV